MSYSYDYPRAALTVDTVIFGVSPGRLQVLLIKRKSPPFEDSWAFPGGFFDLEDDSADAAAAREVEEETGVRGLVLEQFYTFSKRDRDPRERVLSIAYYTVVRPETLSPMAGDDAKETAWQDLNNLPPLAFDHAEVLQLALKRLRSEDSLLREFDPAEFTRIQFAV